MREIFAGQLQGLRNEVAGLSKRVSAAISDSADALRLRDIETGQRVIDGDHKINQLRWDIEQQALVVIATQSPIASDLRTVASVIHISGELERMADHAVCIARIAIDIASEPFLKPLIDLPRMAELCVTMLDESIAAFENGDSATARCISLRDSDVDALYDQIYRELLVLMMADPATITRATPLLRAAHNFERIADRVTNICERVVFTATGELVELQQSA
jgi:phosphate transport system protein